MELKRFKDVMAVKKGEKIWGFHARNLQVAELDSLAWRALNEPSVLDSSALREISQWNQETDPGVTTEKNHSYIRTLVINITQICNLRCVYCAAGGDGSYGSKKGKVDLEKVKNQLAMFIEKVPEGESFHINFLGGEPLLHPDAISSIANYVSLLKSGRDIRIEFGITTNGTLIDAKIAELLARIRCHVTVSMDGKPETNDIVRPTANKKGSSQKTMAGLDQLMLVRDRLGSLSVNAVYGKHNMKVLEGYQFFRAYDFDAINILYAFSDEDQIYSEKFIDQMDQVLSYADLFGERELRKFTFLNHYFASLDNQVRTVNHCGAGKSLLFTDTRADLYTCAWLMVDQNEKVGEQTTLDVAKLREYQDPLLEKNNCQTCWARFLCGGGCMNVNKVKKGDKFLKDEYFCKRTRALVALGIHYYGKYRSIEQGA